MDLVGSLLVQFATIATAVWGLLQMLPATKSVNYKLWLSFALGPIFGIAAHYAGLVELGGLIKDSAMPSWNEEIRHLFAAGFLGLLSTILAKVAHDQVIDPMLQKRKTPPPSEGP